MTVAELLVLLAVVAVVPPGLGEPAEHPGDVLAVVLVLRFPGLMHLVPVPGHPPWLGLRPLSVLPLPILVCDY